MAYADFLGLFVLASGWLARSQWVAYVNFVGVICYSQWVVYSDSIGITSYCQWVACTDLLILCVLGSGCLA